MLLERLRTLPERLVAFDTETWLITADNLMPRVVCGSVGWLSPGPRIDGALLDRQRTLEMFCQILDDEHAVLGGANIAFDLGVCARALAEIGVDSMPSIFRALEQGRVFDPLIAEALDAIQGGHLGLDPRTGKEMRDPLTGKPGRHYSLAKVVDLVLGRIDSKANDEYRLRYRELDGIPLEQWPQAAKDYPIDDARNTAEVILAESGHMPRVSTRHRYGAENNGAACLDCGSSRFSDACMTRRSNRNLIDLADQVHTAFALHLGAAWGFRVDQNAVEIIEKHATQGRADGIGPFIAGNIVRDDGTEDRSVLKRLVALAYGASETCPHCGGTGKVPSAKVKTLRCPECRGRCQPYKQGGTLKPPSVTSCATCNTTGQIPHPKPDMVTCFAWQTNEHGELEQIKTCDGTGLVILEEIPRSDADGLSFSRDTLSESGDEFLMSFAEFKEDEKVLKDYVPFLKKARVPVAGHASECASLVKGAKGKKAQCTCQGPYLDIPLTLKPSVILETGRVSYSDYIQLMPRKKGFVDRETKQYIPSLRECFVARDGYVFSSEDFAAGELVTHGQSCLWLFEHSVLADALNNDLDPHRAFGCTLLGISYAEYNKKTAMHAAARQIGKGWNFGKPGGASDPTVVLQQRVQGPNTPCIHGPSKVEDGDGNLVQGYKGMRICVLMGATDRCGVEKTTKIQRRGYERKIKPTCVACLKCAETLGDVYKRQWPENDEYFSFIKRAVKEGMTVTEKMLTRWPHWREFFHADQQLAPGELVQHVSGRVRGGLEFTQGANSLFQGLLGDISKAALRRVVRECYDATYVVPNMKYETSRPTSYSNAQSPLYGSRAVGFFHDELFCEHPESNGHDGATRVAEIMIDEMVHYCPQMRPAAKVAPTLIRRWYKAAEPTYVDALGRSVKVDDVPRTPGARLIPWEPKVDSGKI